MKKGIHPEYFQTKVTCACGESFVTGSTKKDLRVEVCSKCHPFFTGKQKIMDSEGRVERFRKRYASQKKKTEDRSQKPEDKEKKTDSPQKAEVRSEKPEMANGS